MAPRVVRHRRTILVIQIDRVHQFAVDVELELLASAVADAHRARAAVALQVVEDLLGQLVPTVDAVHDLQGTETGSLLGALLQPSHDARPRWSSPGAGRRTE